MHKIDTNEEYKKLNEFWKDQAKRGLVWDKFFLNSFSKENRYKKNYQNQYFSKWDWFKNGQVDIKKTLFGNKMLNQVFIKSFNSQNKCIQFGC